MAVLLVAAATFVATAASGPASPGQGSWAVGPLQPVGPDAAWAWLSQASVTNGAAYAEEVALTVDGGRSWSDRTPAGLGKGTGRRSITQVAGLSPEEAWLRYGGLPSSSPQALMMTTDGGLSWRGVGPLPSPNCWVQFVTARVGWCTVSLAAMGNDPVVIYRTSDGGRHWQLESRSPSLQARGTPGSLPAPCDKLISFAGTNRGWAAFTCATGTSPLYESTDAGRTWAARHVAPVPPGDRPRAGYPADWTSAPVLAGPLGAVGMSVEGTSGRTLVYATIDEGLSWRAVVPPGRPRAWYVDIVTPTIWKLTYGTAVLTTTDAGRAWQFSTSTLALPGQSGGPQYVTAKDGWFVPVDGTEIERTVDGGASWHEAALPPFPA